MKRQAVDLRPRPRAIYGHPRLARDHAEQFKPRRRWRTLARRLLIDVVVLASIGGLIAAARCAPSRGADLDPAPQTRPHKGMPA